MFVVAVGLTTLALDLTFLVIAGELLFSEVPPPNSRHPIELAMLSLVLVTPFASLATYAAWQAVARRSVAWIRRWTFTLGGLALFIGFGTIANVGEALADSPIDWSFLLMFAGTGAGITAILAIGSIAGRKWRRARLGG